MIEKCRAYVELMKVVDFLTSDYDDGPFATTINYFVESIGHDMMKKGLSEEETTIRLGYALEPIDSDIIVGKMVENITE